MNEKFSLFIQSDLNFEVLKKFSENNIEIPFPKRDVSLTVNEVDLKVLKRSKKMNSHYLFWNNSYLKQAESVLESIIEQQGLILQQTLFYPASGGQPYDQGIIKIGNYSLKVEVLKSLKEEKP